MVQVVVFGDNVDTDVIAPGGYLHLPLNRQIEHCMEALYPKFSDHVKHGDVVVAGSNFGTGSSREQAPALLKYLGIDMIVARSFSRLFFRNAVNVGLLPCVYEGAMPFADGEYVILDMKNKRIESGKKVLAFETPEGIPLQIIDAGGMINFARSFLEHDRTIDP